MQTYFLFLNYSLIGRMGLVGTEEITNIWLQVCDAQKVLYVNDT